MRTLAVALALCAAGFAALSVDLPVARACARSRLMKWLSRPLNYGESFGHALGAVLILATVAVVDERRRRFVPRMAAAAFGAGLAANLIKTIVHRTRPASVSPTVSAVTETFGEWWPGPHGPASLQSFPSAHSAVAIALALSIAAYYPRGRWLAGVMAALCVLHRLASGAHFVSDTLIGLALGWTVAAVCLSVSLFDPLERDSQR